MDSSPIERSELLLDRLQSTLEGDPRAANLVAALRDELLTISKQSNEAHQLIQDYQEAYEKLTAPANRVGVLIGDNGDGTFMAAVGSSEYRVTLDPKLKEVDALQPGIRILTNEAFAIVGVLDFHSGGNFVAVREVHDSGLLTVGAENSQTRMVRRSGALIDTKVTVGDQVRVEPEGIFAVEHRPQKETQTYFVEEVPEVPWSAIGGQHDAIKLIRDTIELPLLHPEIFESFDKKPIKGILLYGPPGCGKTMIGKATAYNLAKEYSQRVGHEVKECFLHINGPKILNMWLGESERMVREIFEIARRQAKEGRLVVVFIDEAESILRTRSSGRFQNISNTIVPQFCAEMDGLVGLENVAVILTSNRPDYIDPAILRPERIDRKVKVVRPDFESAKTILTIYIHDKLPIDPELVARFDGEPSCARKELIEQTAKKIWECTPQTEVLQLALRNGSNQTLYFKDLVSGALLKSIVERSKDFAIARAIADSTTKAGIRVEDLEAATWAEYGENEIFPRTDVMADWLKLIDIEPELVANVRPVRAEKSTNHLVKSII